MIVPLLFALLLPSTNCRVIQSDRIYARDLAAAEPVFAKLPADTEVGFAPVPGLQRVFRVGELRRLAKANHLEGEPAGDVCFAWETAVPDRPSLLAAMRKSLNGRETELEVVDQSLLAAPKGEVVFPLEGLGAASLGPVVWRGYISYAAGKHFAIWARVRIKVKEQRVVAAEDLRSGEVISAMQIRLQPYEGLLTREAALADPEQVIGKVMRWNIPAGTVLAPNMIAAPNDVERGETVTVVVLEGSARIEAQGIAEQSGKIGCTIDVRNPKSGRRFRARIDSKGKVEVVPGGQVGLAPEEEKS